MNWRVLVAGIIVGMLTSTLFYATLAGTRRFYGPNYGEAGLGEYDPWLDINDDGKIDVQDSIAIWQAYGTTGDPTKPVIINGYYAMEWNKTAELNESESITYRVSTVGLKKLTLQVSIWPRVWFGTFPHRYGYANATIIITGQILL